MEVAALKSPQEGDRVPLTQWTDLGRKVYAPAVGFSCCLHSVTFEARWVMLQPALPISYVQCKFCCDFTNCKWKRDCGNPNVASCDVSTRLCAVKKNGAGKEAIIFFNHHDVAKKKLQSAHPHFPWKNQDSGVQSQEKSLWFSLVLFTNGWQFPIIASFMDWCWIFKKWMNPALEAISNCFPKDSIWNNWAGFANQFGLVLGSGLETDSSHVWLLGVRCPRKAGWEHNQR